MISFFSPGIKLTTGVKPAASGQRSKRSENSKNRLRGIRTLLPQLELLIERKQSCGFQRNSIIWQKDTRVLLGWQCAKVKGHRAKNRKPQSKDLQFQIAPNSTIPKPKSFCANVHLRQKRSRSQKVHVRSHQSKSMKNRR